MASLFDLLKAQDDAARGVANPLLAVAQQGQTGAEAKRKGHDALIVRNVDDTIGGSGALGTSYAVFGPEQIVDPVPTELGKTGLPLLDYGIINKMLREQGLL